MADTKVSALTALTAPDGEDKLYIYDDSTATSKAIKLIDIVPNGTFTPELEGSTGGTATHTTASGNYLRFGDMCLISIYVVLSDKTGITGDLRLSGLPFAASNGWSLAVSLASGFTITANHVLTARVDNANNYVVLSETDGSATTNLTDSELGTTSSIALAGMYRTTAAY